MNQIDVPLLRAGAEPPRERVPEIDLARLWAMVRRQWHLPLLGGMVGAALAIAYLATTPATYTAAARVLVEDRMNKLVEEVSPAPVQQRNDATILSEIEILHSTRMARKVARELDLWRNPDFMNPPSSLLSRAIGGTVGAARDAAKSLIASEPDAAPGPPPTDAQREAARLELAVLRLQSGLVVQRAGRSYAILVGFRSHSPVLARDIANAYTRIYLADELDASLAASQRAAEWMQARLVELERDSQSAALAAARFRAENGLTSARGELVSDQELSELSSQLVLARAEAARAQARFRQYAQVAERPTADAISEAVLRDDGEPVNPTLVQLREDYQGVDRRLRDVTRLYGADHPQAVALTRERRKLENSIELEVGRTVRALENAYLTAKAREDAIATSVDQATGRSAQASEAQVRLSEMEQRAEALAGLYQTFLARFEQVSKQQSFPLSKVRVLSEATLPRGKSAPSSTLTLAMLTVLGGMAGAGVGALRELRERFMRTEEDVRRTLDAPFLGYVPRITVSVLSDPPSVRGRGRKADGPDDGAGAAAAPQTLDDIAVHAPASPAGGSPAQVERARMLAAAASPSSMLSETMRDIRIAADVVAQDRPFKVIGVISALPGEGKSTIAANLAAHIAAGRSPTMLIDADMRKPTITRTLTPQATEGLVDALTTDGRWSDVAGRVAPDLPLAVVPNVITRRVTHASELLSSRAMRSFLQDTGEVFPYIVVDLPPIVPVADARAMAPLIDAFVLVAAWGETPRALLRNQIAAAPLIRQRLLGVVLNRVDVKRLHHYEGDEGRGGFIDQLGGYYTQPSRGVVRV